MNRRRVKIGLVAACLCGVLLLMLPVALMAAAFGTGSVTTPQSCPAAPAAVVTTSAQLDAAQLANADTVIGVALARPELNRQAALLGLMGALQESTLRNLGPGQGDRDSVGIFQQRASTGWGTVAEEENTTDASGMFYGIEPTMTTNKGLEQISGWQYMTPTAAVQKVQGSAYPTAYAKWQPLAQELLDGAKTSGGSTTVNNCTVPAQDLSATIPAGSVPPAIQSQIAQANPEAQAAIAFALKQVGCKYQWGGTGPCSKGFDCSGLTQAAYGAAGVVLPRDTYSQIDVGQEVAENELEPGDLVFPDAGHVQIFLGWDGSTGYIVEAPSTGLKVRVVPMWAFWKARRVV